MNTPAHLIFGAAAFGKPGARRVTGAALAGSLLPDVSLFVLVGWSILINGTDAHTVFRQYYFSDIWQRVFAIDNSFLLWGILLGIALWRRGPALIAFAASGMMHLGFDFVLHNEDARMQFWPLSDWRFRSPFSYWDQNLHAGVVGPLELGASLLLCAVLIARYRSLPARMLFVFLGMSEVLTSDIWGIIH